MKYSQVKELLSQQLDGSYANMNDLFTASKKFIGYQELEMDSSFIDVHDDISYIKDKIPLHSHPFWEILLVKSGNPQYLIGDTRYQLRKNDIVLLPCGISHRPLFGEKLTEPYHRIVIWVNADFFKKCVSILYQSEHELENSIPDLYYVTHPTGSFFYQIEQIFESLLYEKQHSRLGEELLCIGLFEQLLTIFYRILHYQDAPPLRPEKADLLDEILDYVENHLSQPISLKCVSEKFHVSPSAISHLFKKQMDSGFYRVVIQRRLIESKNHIIAGVSLNEIPDLCGFSDYSVFYKAFKKEYGISPKEFKNKLTEISLPFDHDMTSKNNIF